MKGHKLNIKLVFWIMIITICCLNQSANCKTLELTMPDTVYESDSYTEGYISIDGILDDDLFIFLSSSDNSRLIVSNSITIMKNYTSTTFNIEIIDNNDYWDSVDIVIKASADGYSDVTKIIYIKDDDGHPSAGGGGGGECFVESIIVNQTF